MPAKSKAQQRFMGMVHAVQKGDMDAPSSEVEKAADSMSDADAKDYASTKHTGLPNHVKKEIMEKELKEIIRQTYRDSLKESINEDAAELPQATIPSAVKVKLQMAIDKIKDSKLSNNAKLQLVAQVIDALDVDKSQLSTIANKIRSKMESVQMNEISSIDGLVDVVKGQTSHIEGIKLSKDMAGHIISWMNTSPYGKKYNSWVKKNSISKILPIAFNWGLDRGVQSNLKNEFAALKAKYGKAENESVNESVSHEAMGIASMTNTRKEAVQKFIDDNNLNALEILKDVTKGKLPERVRFIQALVGTPGNSSFKWYVKTYANESVNEGIKYNNDGFVTQMINAAGKVVKDITLDGETFLLKGNKYISKKGGKDLHKSHFGIKESVNEGTITVKTKDGRLQHYPNFKKDDVISFLTKNKMKQVNSPSELKSNMDFYIVEGVNEGKKAFKINPGIGSSKYSISSHDGVKKHKDGSDFYDIEIFKNKVDLEKGIKKYSSNGFIQESVIKEDVYKTILSNDKGKMFFGLVDDETRDVKFLDAVTWIKSTIKDKASDSSKELVLAALVRQINQFNRKVEYNMWVNANKPTWEEKIKHLLDKRLVNNVNRGGIKVH